MKELIEKLKKYNRWRRGDETVPLPHPQEVGEMIDHAIKVIEDYLKHKEVEKIKNYVYLLKTDQNEAEKQ